MFKLGDVMTASKSSSAFDPRRTANSRTRHGASLACLVLAGTVSAGAHADNSATATAAPDLEEIVVTATRRAESIDKIPISISAFSQPKMDEQGIKSVEDLARFTPGLTFAPSTDGLTSSIAIRGIASGVGASTTGIYINDTPIQVRSGTGIVTQNSYPQIFDLERVEVLKGPQGTLFGTGSMGGTIRFITPEPNLNTYSGYSRAETSATKSGDPSYEMGAAVGGPIIDGALGFRASAFYQNEGGYINRQPFTGDTVTQKGVNFSDTTVLRYAVKWAPSDSVTITPSIYYQKQRRNDAYFWESLSNPGETDFNSGYTLPEPITDSFTLPALDVHWKLGSVELISNTSFFYRSLRRDSDYSNYLFDAFTGNPTPTAPVADYRALSQFDRIHSPKKSACNPRTPPAIFNGSPARCIRTPVCTPINTSWIRNCRNCRCPPSARPFKMFSARGCTTANTVSRSISGRETDRPPCLARWITGLPLISRLP
jgi:iron complex outermembrane receptor protein